MPNEPVSVEDLPHDVLALERDMPGLRVKRPSAWQRLRAAARQLADLLGAGARIARITVIAIAGLLALAIGLALLALFIALFAFLWRELGFFAAVACTALTIFVIVFMPNRPARGGGADISFPNDPDEFSNTRMILGTDFSPPGQDRHERYWNH